MYSDESLPQGQHKLIRAAAVATGLWLHLRWSLPGVPPESLPHVHDVCVAPWMQLSGCELCGAKQHFSELEY